MGSLRLEDDMRERLLNYYIKRITHTPQSPFTKGGLRGITENEFRETLLPCRLQRHMQALDAYGFLSKIKGKKYFLKSDLQNPLCIGMCAEDYLFFKLRFNLLFDIFNILFPTKQNTSPFNDRSHRHVHGLHRYSGN